MNIDLLRLATVDDAPAIAAIYAPSVTDSVASFELVVPGPEEMSKRIAKVLDHAPWLVLIRDEQIVGYAYASRHRDPPAYLWSVNSSVYVRAGHQRTGAGRKLYRVLMELLRVQGFYSVHTTGRDDTQLSVTLSRACLSGSINAYPRIARAAKLLADP